MASIPGSWLNSSASSIDTRGTRRKWSSSTDHLLIQSWNSTWIDHSLQMSSHLWTEDNLQIRPMSFSTVNFLSVEIAWYCSFWVDANGVHAWENKRLERYGFQKPDHVGNDSWYIWSRQYIYSVACATMIRHLLQLRSFAKQYVHCNRRLQTWLLDFWVWSNELLGSSLLFLALWLHHTSDKP